MKISEIATKLTTVEKHIVLIYAFNATGKTRLSVAFKDKTKDSDGNHTGVYYNAFSEDLFVWDNDIVNNEQNIRLSVFPSSLSKFHRSLTEDAIREKLAPYNPKFDFTFNLYENLEKGIKTISFFIEESEKEVEESEKEEKLPNIKISRGEERIFIWCFFLALFEVADWTDNQPNHFFIDDPVSSLDDNNIFITVEAILDLIESHFKNKKIIITTHHIGLFSILRDRLTKGEKASKFKKVEGEGETKKIVSLVDSHILCKNSDDELELKKSKDNIPFYHLHLLQMLDKANEDDKLYNCHFVLLRQLLENIASFLGSARFGHVLKEIQVENHSQVALIINNLSHKKSYYHEFIEMTHKDTFKDVLTKLKEKYNFKSDV